MENNGNRGAEVFDQLKKWCAENDFYKTPGRRFHRCLGLKAKRFHEILSGKHG